MNMNNPFSLAGRQALITGGGTGIGLGIAKALTGAGARTIIAGRREEVLKQAAEEIGGNCHYISYDITDRAGLPALVERIEK